MEDSRLEKVVQQVELVLTRFGKFSSKNSSRMHGRCWLLGVRQESPFKLFLSLRKCIHHCQCFISSTPLLHLPSPHPEVSSCLMLLPPHSWHDDVLRWWPSPYITPEVPTLCAWQNQPLQGWKHVGMMCQATDENPVRFPKYRPQSRLGSVHVRCRWSADLKCNEHVALAKQQSIFRWLSQAYAASTSSSFAFL